MSALEWDALWAAMDAQPEHWHDTTEHMFDEMLGCVPPAAMGGGGFLVGDAHHHNTQGEPVFAGFVRTHGGHYQARYMTIKEFNNRMAVMA